MRIAYLGTSGFASVVLRRLAESPYRPALVVTPPDRPKGRGRKLSPSPVAALASELDINLHQTADVNEPESTARLGEAGIEIGMVCAFGQILRTSLLERIELWNVHPSLLPRWRGAAPIERAIMAGDEETGVAIMRVGEGLDSGPVALCESTPIAFEEDFGSLEARLAELGGDLAVRAFELRERDELNAVEQDDAQATYAEKIESQERRLDPSRPAIELERRIRALTPHIGAYLELEGGDRLGIVRSRVVRDAQAPPQGQLEVCEDAPRLGTTDGALDLLIVRPPGKRDMFAADYLRGHGVPRPAR